jgi:hypothetical protein
VPFTGMGIINNAKILFKDGLRHRSLDNTFFGTETDCFNSSHNIPHVVNPYLTNQA